MQKQTLRLRKRSASRFLFPSAATALALLFLLVIFPLVPEIKLASATLGGTEYDLTLTTNSNINLNINPTTSGAISVAKDTVVANTNSPSGYKLYLSVNKDLDNNIYLEGDTSNDSTTTKFVPTTGTFETPSALDQNSWGYAIAGLNGFDTSYTTPSTSSKFANVPLVGNEQLIHEHTGAVEDDTTEVYFAVNANTEIASGHYVTEILYTTLTDIVPESRQCEYTDGYSWDFAYTGNVQEFAVPCKGTYKLEVWGAQGSGAGGKGGYSSGNIALQDDSKIYVVVGGQDRYNGGGSGGSDPYNNGYYNGGGATHIAKVTGLLNAIEYDSFVTQGNGYIVAGGGGGGSYAGNTSAGYYTQTGGSGGGLTGGEGENYRYSGSGAGNGGTQTTGHAFGLGQSTSSNGAGGGGGFYGGYAGRDASAGGGGSGYIGGVENGSMQNGIQSGNGKATITLVEAALETQSPITVSPSTLEEGYEPTTITIATSLYTSKTLSSATVTVGENSCTNVTIINQNPVTITCTLPTLEPGSYGISVDIPGAGKSYTVDNMITIKQSLLVMQDVLDWMDDLELEQQVQVVDSRDNKIYWVAKLKDGNIWMTQNLDYDITTSNNIVSNLDGTTSIWRAHPAATYAPQVTSTTVFNNSDETGTYSYDPGSNYIPNGTGTPTAITCTSTSNGGENCHYHQGNYYQYNAVTAGTGGTITNADATSSICPKGWRLPTSNSAGVNYSFGNLVKQYGYTGSNQIASDSTLLSSPLFFVRGGSVSSGSLNDQGSRSHYWSSTAYSYTYGAHNLVFYSSYVSPSSNGNRYYGFSVRCVAINPTLNDISTMQEMTPAIVAATPENTFKQLIDTRDNKLYWVAKLKDGNIWMTQNLDYDIKAGDNIVSNLDGTTSIWNTSSTYVPQATTTSVFNSSSSTGTYSYDPGSNYIPNGIGTPIAITCTSTTNGGENCHYHQGNYYQWNTATAGTGGTITDTDATSSICPKGWRLPTSGSYTENYSFGKLTNAYGITSSADGTSDSALLASPFFFARGGYVDSGSLYNQGSYGGYYWSSRAYSGTYNAYLLLFNSSLVYPSRNYNRYHGFSVRCVAL